MYEGPHGQVGSAYAPTFCTLGVIIALTVLWAVL
jgi:hypothetical protein